MILSAGIAQSHASPSIKRSSHGIESTLRISCWRQAQSTHVWRRSDDLPTRQRIAASERGTRCRYPPCARSKKAGHAAVNWLTVDEAHSPWQIPNMHSVKGKRDRAILSVLLGGGRRRRELVDLTVDHIQRLDHWAIIDMVGKGGHIGTVPIG
jgi:integrase